MRVYELAKKLEVTSEAIIEVLEKAGIPAKSHMSGMDEKAVELVQSHFKVPKQPAKRRVKAKVSAAAKPAKAKGKPETKRAEVEQKRKAAKSAKPKSVKKTAKKGAKARPPAKDAAKAAAPLPEKVAKKVKGKPKPPTEKRAVPPPRAPERMPERPEVRKPKLPKKRPPADIEAQQKAVRESVRRTLAKLEVTRRTRRRKAKLREEAPEEKAPIKVRDNASVHELATALGMEIEQILDRCTELGVKATVNQNLNREVIEIIAEDLDRSLEFETEYGESQLAEVIRIDPAKLKPRAPIVTIMGHVDHGKTSILDYIRRTNVVASEAGGITQHIGAYEVEWGTGKITFIDTPGHEAFTAMRARGAKVTDIVVLVVAADDGVMPQTKEAINHTNAAEVPMIVAINKIDLPAANPYQVKQQLANQGVVVESFGGDIVDVDVSAKTGEGIDKLLEMILLQGEMMELKADPEAPCQSIVVEVKKEEERGILCTVLVKHGTLRIGDAFVTGMHHGKVRALLDHRGKAIRGASPSTPVLVLGCNGLPEAGDSFIVVNDERTAKEISLKRLEACKDRERQAPRKLTLEELYSQIQVGELKELNLLVKGDTNGSVEALTDNLPQLSSDEVKVKVIHSGVGSVTESDVLLAASTNAVVIGFNVKVSPKVQDIAEKEKVEIKSYNVIYECLREIDDAMKGLLEPERVEKILGRAEVRKVFKISRIGTIAGSFVMEGSIIRNAMVRVLRGDEAIFDGKISSLKRFQDDMREVQKDFECGIGIAGFTDFQEGDVLEAYVIEEKERVL